MLMLMTRLARLGAGGPQGTLVAGEAELAAKLVPGQDAARIWAEAMQDISARVSHARAVNLDPAQVILDMILTIEKTASRAGAVAT